MRHLVLDGREYVLVREWSSQRVELVELATCATRVVASTELLRAERSWRTRPVPSHEWLGFAQRERSFLTDLRALRTRDLAEHKKSRKVEKSTGNVLKSEPALRRAKTRQSARKATKTLDDVFAALSAKFGA